MKMLERIAIIAFSMLISGCFCTTISREYSIPPVKESGNLSYEEVEEVTSIKEYSSAKIPISIKKNKLDEGSYGAFKDHSLLFCLTLGVFPYWDTFMDRHIVSINTPIGEFFGTCDITKRVYMGWVPYMLPFSASKQDIEEDCVAELVKRLVAQNKHKWNNDIVTRLNNDNKKRLSVLRSEMDKLLAIGEWENAKKLCMAEKVNDVRVEYLPRIENVRIAQKKETVERLISNQDFQSAIDLCEEKDDAHKNDFISLCRKAREAKLQLAKTAFAKYDWQHVIRLCEKEFNKVASNSINNCKAKTKETRIRYRRKELKFLHDLQNLQELQSVTAERTSDPIIKELCDLCFISKEQLIIESVFNHCEDDNVYYEMVKKMKNPARLSDICQNKKIPRGIRESALSRVADQNVFFEIACQEGEEYSIRKSAIMRLRNSEKLVDVVLNARKFIEGLGVEDTVKIIKSISLYTAFNPKNEEKVFPFAMEVLNLVPERDTYYYSSRIKHDWTCVEKAARCVSFCVDENSKAKLISEVLDKFSMIKECQNKTISARWTNEEDAAVSSIFQSSLTDNIIGKVIAEGKRGCEWIVFKITPEYAAQLILSGIVKSKDLQISLAKIASPEKITLEHFSAVKSETAKLILKRRMSQEVRNDLLKKEKEVIANLITKSKKYSEDTFSLNGFYLGMPIEDAKVLVEFYLPNSKVVITKENNIEIDVEKKDGLSKYIDAAPPMYFCRANAHGKVYLFNFDKRFLRKWFSFNVQNHKEWVAAFAREYNYDFRSKPLYDINRVRLSSIEVSQEHYVYRNNKKGYVVAYYGEKSVSKDFYTPNNIDAEDSMYYYGLHYGLEDWAGNRWENNKGAKEGTLRVRNLTEGE